jgi:saccharopine dehydrogenase-like NADP-dependent oxidoreductase
VVSCVGPATEVEAEFVSAALDVGVPYVSLCDDSAATQAALRMGEQVGRDGPTVVIGCGLRPGLTNLLFRLGAAEMDSVEAALIAVAASVTSDTGPASELHDLSALGSRVSVLSEGKLETSAAGGSPHLVYFPEPVGWVETFQCAHPEVFTLASSVPQIQDLQWRFGLSEKPAMDVLRASAAAGFGKSSGRRRAWLRLSSGVRPMLERFATGGGWSAARVDVWGTSGGRRREVSLAIVDQLANLTTVPLVWAAVGLGTGAIQKPGVWAPEDVIEARPLIRHLSRRGVRVARLEADPV